MIEIFFSILGAVFMFALLKIPNKGVAVLLALIILAGAIFAIAYREEKEDR